MMSSINILTKLYDQQKSAISLKELLKIIQRNKYEFSPENFRSRHPEKDIYPNLALNCLYPGDDEILKDQVKIDKTDRSVDYLIENNYDLMDVFHCTQLAAYKLSLERDA